MTRSFRSAFVLVALGALAAGASAAVYLEDFESDTLPGEAGFAAAVFEHQFGANEYTGIGPMWGLVDWDAVSPSWSLFLIGTDRVTFDLPASERVDSASVWARGYGASAIMHVIGTAGETTLATAPSGPWELLDTGGASLGEIVEIRLSGMEGLFDDLRIRTTPGHCPGDLNGDGRVDIQDLAILLANFGTASGATYAEGDLDADGDVDLVDLATMLAYFGTICP